MSVSSSPSTTQTRLGDGADLSDVIVGTDDYEAPKVVVEEGDTRRIGRVEDMTEAFNDYLDAKEDAVLVLEGENHKTGERGAMVMPHVHRWKEQYRKKTYAKLKAAERHIKEVWGDQCPTTLLTLTAPHKDEFGEYRSPKAVLEDISEGWDKARRVIRRETEGVKTEYLAVWEPHASGYPHLHVIVFGIASPSLGDKVTDMWTTKYVENASEKAQHVSIKNGRSAQIENPAAYVMKYLSKTLVRDSEGTETAKEAMPNISGLEVFSALLWMTGKRHYSMSQGLSSAIKDEAPESNGSSDWVWEYRGAYSGYDVKPGKYTGEAARKLFKYLDGSPNQPGAPLPDGVEPHEVIQSRVVSTDGFKYEAVKDFLKCVGGGGGGNRPNTPAHTHTHVGIRRV